MTYVVIGLVVLLIILSVALVIFSKVCKKYKNLYETEKINLECLQEEYSNLAKAYNIKKQNKESADEKVSDLHNGNTTADNILPKRKSRT